MNVIELRSELEEHSKLIEKYINKKIPDNISFTNPRFAHLLCDIQYACMLLDWSFSDNYAQWDYWHCMNKTGGLFPFSLEHLLEKLDEATSTGKIGIQDRRDRT